MSIIAFGLEGTSRNRYYLGSIKSNIMRPLEAASMSFLMRYFTSFTLLILSSSFSFANGAVPAVLFASFVVDNTQGAADSGFIVHATNTTTHINYDCPIPLVFNWSVADGVQGVDWDFVEGTALNDENVAIEFITQGCFQIQMNIIECFAQNIASPIDITVAGTPDIIVNDFAPLSSCEDINVSSLWFFASNNNVSVDFEILLDGDVLFSNTYFASAFCNSPGLIDFTDVFETGLLGLGMHQLVFHATGDINTQTTTLSIDFEITLGICSGCMDSYACNFDTDASVDDGSCDYTCCPGPGCCSLGMYWDWNLSECYLLNPTDSNLDGCTNLDDLLDLLADYGLCTVPD
jgi:hypothetical protein